MVMMTKKKREVTGHDCSDMSNLTWTVLPFHVPALCDTVVWTYPKSYPKLDRCMRESVCVCVVGVAVCSCSVVAIQPSNANMGCG